MLVETIEDVLSWTVSFHQNLKDSLKQCSEKNTDERTQMVLNYLADHESSLEHTIKEYINSADKKALHTWCYDYLDNHSILEHGHCESPYNNNDLQHIMKETVDHHEQVLDLFSHLCGRVDTDTAQELLESVKDAEENEIKRMVQTMNRFSDI